MCAAVARWSKAEMTVTWSDLRFVGIVMVAYFAIFKLFVMSYW
jgi:hypothetical protein